MRLERRPSRRRTIAMTSLIDVIFILLLFFLLTSTFTRFGEINISAAAAGRDGTPSSEAPIFLRIDADALSVNGATQTLSTLRAALDGLAPIGGNVAPVLVAVDASVSSQRLVDLLLVLRPVEWADVVVLR